MNPLSLLALAVFATAESDSTFTKTIYSTVRWYSPLELAARLPPIPSVAPVESASSASLASRQSVTHAPKASASRASMLGASELTPYVGVVALAWRLNLSLISNTSSTLQSSTAVTASTNASASDTPLTSSTAVGGAGTAGVAIGVLAAVAANLL